MMDVWLIFNLFVPFSEVLLHTFIDSFRNDDERESINHHGALRFINYESPKLAEEKKKTSVIKVKPTDLIHRDEEKEIAARKELYRQLKDKESEKMRRKRLIVERLAKWGIPSVFTTFCIVYFAVAVYYYNQ